MSSLTSDILRSQSFRKAGGNRPAYYKYVFDAIRKDSITGLWMEFGVSGGRSIKWLSKNAPTDTLVYGFDSFEGLPEEFDDGERVYPRGQFGVDNIPAMLRMIGETCPNVRLVKGMFQDTLVPFLSEHDDLCSVVHIDSDLYSSASYILKELRHRITVGTYILFDEIRGNKKMERHENRALTEFLQYTKHNVCWVAHLSNAPQATCKIIRGT